MKPALSSLYQSVELRQPIPPLLIGERANANGSRLFRERLLADDFQGCVRIGIEQESGGAQVLDLCAAYAGRNELADMTALVPLFAASAKAPLMIDSTTPDVIEACLKLYPGRCIVNSINLEDGGGAAHRVCALLKKYGAATVALTIDTDGMAMTVERKVAVARAIYDLAVGEFGLRPEDLLFDTLTFTVGAGDETLRDSARQTLRAITEIKRLLPGVGTVLGVSNISFGLPPAARRVLNSVFLHEAVAAGLDAAIVDAAKVMPLARIDPADRELCLDLLYDRGRAGGDEPLMRVIERFGDDASAARESNDGDQFKGAESAMISQVLRGDKEGLEDQIAMLLERFTPLAVINEILVPAMRQVGEQFGRGELLLPFVLQSAEVMKRAVSLLEPLLSREEATSQTRVLLATVQGDVHDIGKNLVDIILSNNGYSVRNLGIKVSAETIIKEAREWRPDVIGLSGLLVKSAQVMRDSMRQYEEAGLTQPILLGGAALTPRFVAEECAPGYSAPIVYCKDAFAGLNSMRSFEAGALESTRWEPVSAPASRTEQRAGAALERGNPVPTPPFIGSRCQSVELDALLPYLNKQALVRGHWGYRRAKMAADEYERLLSERVEPLYADLLQRVREESLARPSVAYGYFRCFSRENELHVENGAQNQVFSFPRQKAEPFRCIADYFKSREEGGDIASFFVVTMGDAIAEAARELFAADRYHDYLLMHGLGVELTEALAEYWHATMRQQLGIHGADSPHGDGPIREYQGQRYGFGYVACPDLSSQQLIFNLLDPARIGVTLSETMFMEPEYSTAAIIAHHPQAGYFLIDND